MFAVCVTFHIHPDQLDAFLPLMDQNARTSLTTEPGCQRFDVCQNPDTPTHVFLYEIYDDRAAFDHHLKTSHFLSFDKAVSPMIASKSVDTFDVRQS